MALRSAAPLPMWGKALFLAPAAFIVGVCLSELRQGMLEEDAVVEKRVQQALGLWRPPPLSDAERGALERERGWLLHEIAVAESKLAKEAAVPR